MSKVVMIYEAKCKHCLHFKYVKQRKLNGELRKKLTAICVNDKSGFYQQNLTLKSKSCDKLEL